MAPASTSAARLVARALRRVPCAERAAFLAALMAHTANGLAVIHGADATAETIRDLSEAVAVMRGPLADPIAEAA